MGFELEHRRSRAILVPLYALGSPGLRPETPEKGMDAGVPATLRSSRGRRHGSLSQHHRRSARDSMLKTQSRIGSKRFHRRSQHRSARDVFAEISINLDQAVERIKKSIDPTNQEWKTSENDFLTVAAIARYQARTLMSADNWKRSNRRVQIPDSTPPSGNYVGARRQWDRIVKLTDGKYLLPKPNIEQIEERVKKYEQSEHPGIVLQHWPPTLPHPAMEHVPPPFAVVSPAVAHCRENAPWSQSPSALRTQVQHYGKRDRPLHYSAEAISLNWDLMYYFEMFNSQGSGWLQPDPQTSTPFYIVKVQPAPPPKEDPGKSPSAGAAK